MGSRLRAALIFAAIVVVPGLAWQWISGRNFGTGTVAGIGLIVAAVLVVNLLPARLRFENKPRWMQVGASIALLLFWLPGTILPAYPTGWRDVLQVGFLATGLVLFFWPVGRRSAERDGLRIHRGEGAS